MLLVLGDSLSAEYGLQRGQGWVQLLSNRLQQSGFKYTVVNASISGDTTSGGRSRLPALLKQHRPSIVVIELGGNDGLRGLPVARMQTTSAQWFARARRQVRASWWRESKYRRITAASMPSASTLRSPTFPSSTHRACAVLTGRLCRFIRLFSGGPHTSERAGTARILQTVWPVLEPLILAKGAPRASLLSAGAWMH